MSTSRTLRQPFVRALTLGALLVTAGCGVDTSSEGGALAPATTETPAEVVTIEDLESILPEAADIGAAYRAVTEDDDDGPDPVQDALDEQCPDVAATQGEDDDDDDVSRTYEGPRGRQIKVTLSASSTVRTETELAAYVDAVNDCRSVVVRDSGVDYELTFEAEEVPDIGEQAVRVHLSVTVDAPELSAPVTINTYGVNFRIQDVAAQVTGTDAVNGEQRLAFDESRLDPVIADLEVRIEELTGS